MTNYVKLLKYCCLKVYKHLEQVNPLALKEEISVNKITEAS